MKLWEMSFMGTVMVCGILLVRAAGYRKVSKQIFLILWMIAALRFLTPWQLPWSPEFGGQKVEKMSATWIQEREGTEQVKERQEERASEATGLPVEAGGDSGGYSSLV